MVVIENVKKSELANLKGFTEVKTKKDYELMRLRKEGVILTLYSSGKLLVQGKDEDNFVVRFSKEAKNLEVTPQTIVGTDETLKGDTFGGIVVTGVKANPLEREKLEKFVLGDSKKTDDKIIPVLAKKIMGLVKYSVQELKPIEYNSLINEYGLTRLLNILHQKCNDELKSKDSVFIVDKFPGCTVGDKALFKADEKYVEVASASIIARYVGLEQINSLSKKAGFKLPLGSTHVLWALNKLKRGEFSQFVKIHFKNVKNVFKKQ
jgi:ribonuclease HIII